MKSFSLPKIFGLQRKEKPVVSGPRLILLYHRISDANDPFALTVRPRTFQSHLEIVRNEFQVKSLPELLSGETGTASPAIAVTFDDGYADNLLAGIPILESLEIPATFFICTGYLGQKGGFWWDRLASLMNGAARLQLTIDLPGGKRINLIAPSDASAASLDFAPKLKAMPSAKRDATLAELEASLARKGVRMDIEIPVMTPMQIRQLSINPLAHIGAHTRSHPMLSGLPFGEQVEEMKESARKLEELTGARPRYFAYPYGGDTDYNADSERAAAEAGFEASFINHFAPMEPATRPHRVPRFYVPPLPPNEFRLWLNKVIGSIRA